MTNATNNRSLEGKVFAVTGAGGGIGLATARVLAERGARLGLSDVQKGPLEKVEKELTDAGYDVFSTIVDVRDDKQVIDWTNSIVERYGKLHGSANLAGIMPRCYNKLNIEDIENSDWDNVLAVNLTGLMYCMRAQLKNMIDGGSIVNASSVAGLIGSPMISPYNVSKWGVIGLSKCAASEYGPKRQIRVNAIAPGCIDTPMMDGIVSARNGVRMPPQRALEREGKPEEVAYLVAWLLGDESQYITNTVQVIDGGY